MLSKDERRYLNFLEYELALQEAEEDLIRFAEVTMPVLRFPDDPHKTTYVAAKHHRIMARKMMQVERGESRKVIINTGPRHGKTEICTRRFTAWLSGRNPDKDIIVATYNEKFAQNFGKEVSDIISSQRFKQIFPEYSLTRDNNEHKTTHAGGDLFFLGRQSTTTGRGADVIIVDDPTKNEKEVKTQEFRDGVWEWFTQTLLTRRHTDKAAIVVSQTRWHEDDIVGRISDKSNPAYSAKFAKGFEIIDLPCIAVENDPMGRKVGEPLWPERFGLEYLEEMQEANPTAFSALYQCDPTPEDGVFFSPEEIHEYERSELPQSLKWYVVSDHAVSTKSLNDLSCLVPFGVDETGTAWVSPNITWKRMDSQDAVEAMLEIIREMRPMFWYAERDHISKAIGPFLKKRMKEEGVYCPIVEEHPVNDKVQRAQSGRARCAQGRIMFPKFAPWWQKAKSEMLKFPNGRFDDFVDCVSMIGLKLGSHVSAGVIQKKKRYEPGTYGHLLEQFRRQDDEEGFRKAMRGW